MASIGTSRVPSFPPSSSSFPSSSSLWTYDVFLSFYGEDTRKSFTDHLYAALKKKGIIVFRDDEKLERGKHISQELLKTIQESQYAIVVISKRYAFSKWCLIELTQIMKCKRETGMIVLPIFYHVNPSNVRKQEGSLAEAFARHKENPEIDEEDMNMWTNALQDIGLLVGWHVDNRHESVVVEEISRKILDEVRLNTSNIFEGLVGIGSQVPKIISLLSMGLDDVRFIGICGMGGVGKTTLATIIYDRVSPQFEASCFIAHVREKSQNHGLVNLQRQLICEILKESGINIWNTYAGIQVIAKRVFNKKVFIVLDDVDTEDQLKELAGNHSWFGRGSRIIVTSRNHHLLKRHVDDCYEVEVLNHDESLELFSWKAFQKDHPKEDYVKLCKEVVSYAEGLPLALEVFGSYLFDRPIDAWKAARDQLQANPRADVLDKLQIRFNKLEDSQKRLFLDIACLFDGQCTPKDIHKLECLGHYLAIDIEVLKDNCLIKNFYGVFRMHNLLKKMGQEVVRRESPNEPGKRSRLWCTEDIVHGTDAIESIVLNKPLPKQEQLCFEAFSKMKRLKMLVIGYHSSPCGLHALEWHGDPSSFMLSSELCYLEWFEYPLEFLPTSFHADNLVVFKLSHNSIKRWDGCKSFDKLKYIDMSFSNKLIEILDFSGVPNLEQLDLQHCKGLSKVHPSLGFLKQLRELDMEHCQHLNGLPNEINWESLEFLNLAGCSKLKKFPDASNMTSLRFLDLIGTKIKGFPLSFQNMSSLEYLNLCSSLRYRKITEGQNLCPFMGGFGVRVVGKKFSHIYSLKLLAFSASDVGSNGSKASIFLPPNFFLGFSSLKELDLSYHNLSDTAISNYLSCLSSVKCLNLSGNKLTTIPNSVFQLPDLRVLHLRNCSSLRVLPMPLFSCSSLTKLNLGHCNLLDEMIPDDFSCLTSLEALNFSGNKFTRIPYLVHLSRLHNLFLDDCTQLQALPKLPLQLLQLSLKNCPSLEILNNELDLHASPTTDCTFVAFHIGSDGIHYKILYLHPQSPSIELFHEYVIIRVGPTLALEIPECFNKGITRSSRIIDCCLLKDAQWRRSGCLLLILCQFQELDTWQRKRKKQKIEDSGNPNNGISDDNNPFPHFLCKFEVNGVALEKPLTFSIHKVPSVGPNGFWVYIDYHWFSKLEESPFHSGSKVDVGVSIKSSGLEMEVKDCGACLVPPCGSSELYEVLSEISSHDLDLENLKKAFSFSPCLFIHGPIKPKGKVE